MYIGDGSAVQVYMTARVLVDCAYCGEPLGQGAPGPLAWYTQGEVQGSHSQQHGCGRWNSPQEVGAEIGEGDDPADVLTALLRELDAVVAEEGDRVTARVVAQFDDCFRQ